MTLFSRAQAAIQNEMDHREASCDRALGSRDWSYVGLRDALKIMKRIETEAAMQSLDEAGYATLPQPVYSTTWTGRR